MFLFGRVACESGSDGSSGKSSGHDQPGQYYFVYTRSGFWINSMRDMFSKHIVTGLVGFVESSLTTMVMAMGFALSNLWF